MAIKKIFLTNFILIMVLLAAPTYTLAVQCTGKVQQLMLVTTASDHVVIAIGNEHWSTGSMRFCSMSGVRNNISPEQCRALYSMLLGAQLTGKNVTVQHSADTCDPIASWDTPNPFPYHINIRD